MPRQTRQFPAKTILAIEGHTTTSEHSLTAILAHTQQLLSSEQTGQLAIAPKRSLIRQTKHRLSIVFKQIRQPWEILTDGTNWPKS